MAIGDEYYASKKMCVCDSKGFVRQKAQIVFKINTKISDSKDIKFLKDNCR